jgi:hypothetical protein
MASVPAAVPVSVPATAVTEIDWRVLLETLRRRHCGVVIGPDLPPLPAREPLGEHLPRKRLLAELSNRLARIIESEERLRVDAPDDFPLVAQLFVDRRSRTELEIVARMFYEERQAQLAGAPLQDELFENLVALPIPLFICSRHDRLLEHFLSSAGKRPTTLTYDFRGGSQHTVGAGHSDSQPLVYHLFGSTAEPGSLALTQRDQMDLLQAILACNPALPADLRNQITEKSFLFLGCGLNNPFLRILLYVLGFNRSSQRSFALEAADAESVWFYRVEYRTLKLLHVEPTAFITELRRFCDAEGCAATPASIHDVRRRPKVFISYESGAADTMKRIKAGFERHGVEAWVDEEGLRFKDDWSRTLVEVIDNHVDFFVLLITAQLTDWLETYVHNEVRLALERRRRRGAVKFIYALQIGPHDNRLSALDDERIQTTRFDESEAQFEELTKDIRREHARLRRR